MHDEKLNAQKYDFSRVSKQMVPCRLRSAYFFVFSKYEDYCLHKFDLLFATYFWRHFERALKCLKRAKLGISTDRSLSNSKNSFLSIQLFTMLFLASYGSVEWKSTKLMLPLMLTLSKYWERTPQHEHFSFFLSLLEHNHGHQYNRQQEKYKSKIFSNL